MLPTKEMPMFSRVTAVNAHGSTITVSLELELNNWVLTVYALASEVDDNVVLALVELDGERDADLISKLFHITQQFQFYGEAPYRRLLNWCALIDGKISADALVPVGTNTTFAESAKALSGSYSDKFLAMAWLRDAYLLDMQWPLTSDPKETLSMHGFSDEVMGHISDRVSECRSLLPNIHVVQATISDKCGCVSVSTLERTC